MRSVNANVQGLQALLPIENHAHWLTNWLGFWDEDVRVLKVSHKVTERYLHEAGLPKKQRSKWISPHDAIEEQSYLIWLPDKLTLKIGQNDSFVFDFIEQVHDGSRSSAH